MRSPTLLELSQTAELVAAIAIVISLIYVGRQVQDNTSAIRSASGQAVANAGDVAMQTIAANADLARIRQAGDADYSSLSNLDLYRYQIYSRGQWLRAQNVFSQYRLGVLDDVIWSQYGNSICQIAATSGGEATFAETESVMDEDFVEFVKSCNVAGPVLAAPDQESNGL